MPAGMPRADRAAGRNELALPDNDFKTGRLDES
jgi:hypothetical protein